MNITLLPEDILNIIFKLSRLNINNILITCKLFNKIINMNIAHIYTKNTYEYFNSIFFQGIVPNIYNYFTGQNITNEKTLTLIKSQYKIYDYELCEISVDNNEYLNFIKNKYDNSIFDYIHFYDNLRQFYSIVITIKGRSNVAYYYKIKDKNVVQQMECAS